MARLSFGQRIYRANSHFLAKGPRRVLNDCNRHYGAAGGLYGASAGYASRAACCTGSEAPRPGALAAIVSGSHLPAGEMAIHFARAQGGGAEATVLATDIKTSAGNAALATAILSHADETDDFEPVTKAHPRSHVVPPALALGARARGPGAHR